MGKTTLSDIVKNTSEVIWDVLRDQYLPASPTEMWNNMVEIYAKK
jgi:hypothetical protein